MRIEVRAMCKTCYFWKWIEVSYGICRRYPPKVFKDDICQDTYSAWPDTDEDAWCGEYMKDLWITKGEEGE